MKKFIFTAVILAVILAPIFVFAQGDYGLSETMQATGGALKSTVAGESDLPSIAGKIISAGLSLIAVIFFILFLYAGLTWMKAMGSAEDVEKAKKTLEAAVIGLVIVMGAYAATRFIFTSIGGGNGGGGDDSKCKNIGGTCMTGKSPGDICSPPPEIKIIVTGFCPGDGKNLCCAPPQTPKK